MGSVIPPQNIDKVTNMYFVSSVKPMQTHGFGAACKVQPANTRPRRELKNVKG